jgi:hypothetical protein
MHRLPVGLTLIEAVLTPLVCLAVVIALRAGPAAVVALASVSILIIVVSWCFCTLQQSVASSKDLASPHTIATVPTVAQAALIVNELSRNGIRARAMGDSTFGFHQVRVVVTREDRELAEAVL